MPNRHILWFSSALLTILIGVVTVFYGVEKLTSDGLRSRPKVSAVKTERVIVRLKDDRDRKKVARRVGLKPTAFAKNPRSVYFLVEVTGKQKTKLLGDQAVALAEVDEPVKIFLTPNDPKYGDQSNWAQVGAPGAWDITTGSSSITMAVIDTGINAQHEDLVGRVRAGYDYINGREIAEGADSDDHGHGTQVAGVAAATGHNGLGIAGADWAAKIMPVKALDSTGTGSTAHAADAIRYATDNGARVINLSFGRPTVSAVLEEAVNYAWGKGVVIVAATGNDGAAAVSYPAAYTNVIAVGALDGEARAAFSNYGPEIDVVAPGKLILTAKDSPTEYVTVSGTSIAAPVVTGEATLIRGLQPNLTASEVKNQIETQVDKLGAMGGAGQTNEYGQGRVNFEKALKKLIDYSHQVVAQNSYPTLQRGESFQLTLTVKNTGGTTWRRSVVGLGTDRPIDRVPGFIREDRVTGQDSGWIGENRVRMQQSEVRPGEEATFVFWYTVPADQPAGIYREYFRPVAEKIKWLEDYGIYWDVRVLSEAETYQGQWVTQNAHPTILRGQSYRLVVQFKNTGRATWRRGKVNLGTDRPQDRVSWLAREDLGSNQPSGWIAPNRVQFDGQQVKPGETATFSFWLGASQNMTPGTYREYFRLVAESITWMEDYGVFWEVTVQ